VLDQPVGHARPATDPSTGLSGDEAARRRAAGLGNEVDERSARSLGSILKANIFTRFNAVITSLAVVILVFGDPIDAVFGLVMVLNSLIGIVQEVRAKRSLDAVRVLLVPAIDVVRDGEVESLPPDQLVLGDLIHIRAGDQIPVDGLVGESQGLEVDESALTGESDPVTKGEGAEVLSGSVVVAGSATVEATRVGESSWAARLTREAKDFVLTESELRVGVGRLLSTISWILPPLSALLVWGQLRTDATLADGLVSAVAGVVALVPQGLVLLVSMTFAIAVLRLAQVNVVVQELPAVEGLARVDMLCIDKTGTLTTGALAVDRIDVVPGVAPDSTTEDDGSTEDDRSTEGEVLAGIGALARLDSARSATVDALRLHIDSDEESWVPEDVVAFSSVRKWSGATFDSHGTWVLGAPEIILDEIDDVDVADLLVEIDRLTAQARRVLLVARSEHRFGDGERLPEGLRPVAVVSLKEEVRPDAAETMRYFREQNVQVKVISGDNPRTVAAVATELGIPGAGNHVDLREWTVVDDIGADTTVFGRVLPEQKRDLVRLLQSQGHTVAMTGDGVNDIPALKAADIGIAMNTATPATRAIAQLVLLDGRFERLPGVVTEGRRVVANMELVSSLFVTKTVYAALLALIIGLTGVAFPFLPRHLTLIGAITIGIPGFALSFAASDEPTRSGYLRRVLRFSVPAGVIAATATLAAYGLARSDLAEADLAEARTSATMTMMLVGLWILYRLVRPVSGFEAWLLGGLAGAVGIMLIPSPLATFYALELPSASVTAALLGLLGAMLIVLELLLRLVERHNDGSPTA